MGPKAYFEFDRFQRWRKPFEVAFWIAFFLVNAVFNSVTSAMDHPKLAAWKPWVWEFSSGLVILALVPLLVLALRRWPLDFANWRRNLPKHLLASVLFSVVHVSAMVALRKLAYVSVGDRYDFGLIEFGYEYLKDIRTYFGMLALIGLYHLWLMRMQGEARWLAEPDSGPPVEPVEQPERFLVRKLGKEFLLAAREIEWLQASGNYVNLHVRGRDYPLRATMVGIEDRLDAQRFLRVHRSYLINLDYLAEIEPLDTGDAKLVMHDGAVVPCSRRYRAALRERFGQAVVAS